MSADGFLDRRRLLLLSHVLPQPEGSAARQRAWQLLQGLAQTHDVLLASACLPSFNQPVTIDGEQYWDGALTANPPLRPLLYQCGASDMLIVAINPSRRQGAPHRPLFRRQQPQDAAAYQRKHQPVLPDHRLQR